VTRLRVAPGLLLTLIAFTVPQAQASVTVGMVAPTTPDALCDKPFDVVQQSPAVTYVVPDGIASPVITGWSTNAAAGDGQQLALKVFEKAGEPATYRQLSHDGPRDLAGGTLNMFKSNLPVRAGDLLGVGVPPGTAPTACIFGDELGNESHQGFFSDGESAGPFAAGTGLANVSVVIEPSHDFTIGAITKNRKKGTAAVAVTVPGPGSLTLSGQGVRAQTASRQGPRAAKTVSLPGTASLTVKAKGRKRKKLTRTGRVGVAATITYLPTGGSPASQTVQLKLRRKR
jgi:hypothetical protein